MESNFSMKTSIDPEVGLPLRQGGSLARPVNQAGKSS